MIETAEQQARDLLIRMGVPATTWSSGELVELANLFAERSSLRAHVPPAIWSKIFAWLKARGTGRIILDAQRGKVKVGEIHERITDERLDEHS